MAVRLRRMLRGGDEGWVVRRQGAHLAKGATAGGAASRQRAAADRPLQLLVAARTEGGSLLRFTPGASTAEPDTTRAWSFLPRRQVAAPSALSGVCPRGTVGVSPIAVHGHSKLRVDLRFVSTNSWERTTHPGGGRIGASTVAQRLLLLAGECDEPKGDEPLGFSVLTTTPNATMAAIHDRMPVILEAVAAGEWLDAGGDALLRPAPDDLLVSVAANPIMNKAGVEGPECMVVSRAVAG